ncbi:unnamed protein product [Schistosoma rodhaini]|uniref:DDE-1 domain-containing protein n=2 Tax=Schistosoma rodhaini TaxID=6188 RepID=A0A183RJV3_9TREM|nr:unnamed protein product [Schistosoma rodhaini]
MKYKKRKSKLLSWEEKLDRQIQFVLVDNTDENYLSADEPTDVTIMKTVTPLLSKDIGGLRKPCMSKYFEAESVIDLDLLCVSGEDLLCHSSIPQHRQAVK